MSLLSRIALLFVAVPLLELFLLIRLGGAVGLFPTLALCVLTGVAGAWLARREGLRALRAFQRRLARGDVPGRALTDGLCVLAGGALLLAPGLLTDLFGFSLLLPPSRRRIQKRIERKLADGSLRAAMSGGFPGAGGTPGRGFGAGRRFGDEAAAAGEPPPPRPRPGEIIQRGGRENR